MFTLVGFHPPLKKELVARKRFVVYYDESVEGGPKAEVREGEDVRMIFPESEGWTYPVIISIFGLVVNQTTIPLDLMNTVPNGVMVWRVR